MNWVKGFALMIVFSAPSAGIFTTKALADSATDRKPAIGATEGSKKLVPTKAMLTKCSNEADAKGLFVRTGQSEARKAFRRECVRKLMGIDPK
jgi:hypothetical protein